MKIVTMLSAGTKVKCPFKWGDVVKVNNDTTEIIFFPDTNFKESKTFILSQDKGPNGHYQRAIRAWKEMKFVASYEEYTNNKEIVSLMEKYRKCVCINVMKWTDGIDFWGDDEASSIDFLLGDTTRKENISGGGINLLNKFFLTRIHDWRVLIHRKDNWDHWFMFGPFSSEFDARNVFYSKQKEALATPPKFIKHGIYQNDGQINCIALYKGPYLVARHSLLIGQGEELKYSDGINKDVEEFQIPEEY